MLREGVPGGGHGSLLRRPRVRLLVSGRSTQEHPLPSQGQALYDNTRLAVAKILGDGRRKRTRVFSELVSHYLFEDRFGRPGKGNDKGKVEGLVGYARRNFLAPIPSYRSFDELNAHLEEKCLERMERRLRGHRETVG